MINTIRNYNWQFNKQFFLRFRSYGAAFGLALLFLNFATSAFAAGGGVDPTFRAGVTNYNSTSVAKEILVQPDGRMIIFGGFTVVNGIARKGIARLNTDGTLDPLFNPSINGTPVAAALLPDGKIIVAGSFSQVNGVVRSNIARLNADGSLDTSFQQPLGMNSQINAVAVQPDGKIVVVGHFGVNTTPYYITRLNSNGTRDAAFDANLGAGASNPIYSVTLQPDGKILIGGDFTTFNNINVPDRLARLNADGTVDTAFNAGGLGASGRINAFHILSDEKILAAGALTTYNGASSPGIARLNSDGSRDASFSALSNGNVKDMKVAADGDIYLGGSNIGTGVGSSLSKELVRLNSDGTVDNGFNFRSAVTGLEAIALLPDESVTVTGGFESIGTAPRTTLVNIKQDGALENNFAPVVGTSEGASTIVLQPDGKILVGGTFSGVNDKISKNIARLNADGTLDASFNVGSGFDGDVRAIALQPDGKILVGGVFTKYNGVNRQSLARLNADGSLDATFTPTLSGAPQHIAVLSGNKIMIAGSIASVNGVTRSKIARLNFDGSLDTGFVPPSINSTVETFVVDTEGRVVIGGVFSQIGSAAIGSLARLNADGSFDASFNNGGRGASSNVLGLVLLPGNKILAAGNFASYNNEAVGYVVRLNENGVRDTTFNTGTGASNSVYSLAVQTDGKILIGGSFINFNNVSRSRIARLNSDGTLDASFIVGAGAENTVEAIAIQEDGRSIIGGRFTTYNNQSAIGVARLLAGSTNRWTGAANNDWSNSANWSDGVAPSNSDSVVIPAGAAPVINSATTITSLTIEAGAALEINAPLTVQGFTNDGTISGSGALLLAGAAFVNNGTISVSEVQATTGGNKSLGGSGSFVGNTLRLTNNAQIRLDSDHTFDKIVIATGSQLNISSRTVRLKGAGQALQGSISAYLSTVIYEGAEAQQLNNFYHNLVINNAAGVTSASSNPTIAGTLNLQNGVLNTGSQTLYFNGSASVVRTNGYVVGKINKYYASAQNFTFPLGTANGYSPVTINVTAGTPTITAEVAQTNHPSLPASRSLARHWKLSSSDNFTANLTFNYLDADVVGNEANYQITKINGATTQRFPNNCPVVCVDAAANTAQINNVESFSDWTLSENFTPTSAPADLGGRVLANNQPVAGVTVWARKFGTNESFSATTDAAGFYVLPGLPTGASYSLIPQKYGYRFLPDIQFVNHNGERTDLNFAATRVNEHRVANDFDGDGRADIAVFRPENGTWYIWQSGSETLRADNWGLATDELVAGDYDADGKTDVAVFRAGKWYVRQSSQNDAMRFEEFGQAGDVPIVADFDGDNADDFAVFRAGTWLIKSSAAGGETRGVNFGLPTDQPFAADFDGDHKADIAVFRAGVWYILQSFSGQMKAVYFGQNGDVPIAFDSNGDGISEIGVFRPETGTWYIKRQNSDEFNSVQFGQSGDQISVADYDGDSRTDLAVFRAGTWHLLELNGYRGQQFGLATDKPVVKR